MKKFNYIMLAAGLSALLAACGAVDAVNEKKEALKDQAVSAVSGVLGKGGEAETKAGSGETAAEKKTEEAKQKTVPEEELSDFQKQIMDLMGTVEDLVPYTSVRPEEVPENPESDFVFETSGGYTWIKEYVGTSTQVKIPANLGGATEAVQIMKEAFQKNDKITWLYLPETVHIVDDYVFRSCTALEEVYVMGASEIGKGAFKNCTGLRRAELASCENIKGDMDNGAFEDCQALEEIVFPANLKQVGVDAFYGCLRLKEADFSGTALESVGQQAFTDCLKMERLVFPATLREISSNACLRCYSLADISVDPANTSFIVENGVLYYCCPEGEGGGYVASLGVPASKIREIAIKDGTRIIGGNAFGYNLWLEQVTLPDSCEEIERNGFNTCSALRSIDFGQGLKKIGQYAFQYCTSLEEVNLPDSCEQLGDSSFAWIGDSLKKVYLPDNVTYFGDATTEHYVFNLDKNAVFTYRGKEYTYEEAAGWNLK